ncbi:hypothetical protein [Aquimarina sp. I32.4]|nr:hypothetical protein [Aquimarina sp. I32.4]
MKTPYRKGMDKDKIAGYFAKKYLKENSYRDEFIIQHFIPDINI